MPIVTEIKRKLFHHLSLIYMVVYLVLPRWATLSVFTVALIAEGAVEIIRLRRPEVNARLLARFGGIHRASEVLQPSGIFWTLLGCWTTIMIFPDRMIILPALGFLAFGDTAAALCGQKWGKHPVPPATVRTVESLRAHPAKTLEGALSFAAVSCVWALFFVRWPVALISAITAAWLESRSLPWNDNFWIPVLSGFTLSIFNLLLGHSR